MSKPVILCVDDEVLVLDSLKRQFKKAFKNAYLYESAESAQEALELIEEIHEEQGTIIVIISDWLMPGMKGDELLIDIHKKFPTIIKIMLTGQANEEAIERAKKQANLYCCLYKPWDGNKLIETIKSALKTHE